MTLGLDKTTWQRVAFGDVVRNVNVSVKDPDAKGLDRVIAMEHLDPGELRISRWGMIEDGTTFTRRVRPGQTLFGKRRAYQRKAAFAEFDAITSGDILTIEAIEGRLLSEFLPFIVQSDGFYNHALGTSAGSLSPRTNWCDLATFEFDLPPLPEQQRLADLLWAVERHRTAIQQQRNMVKAAQTAWLAKDVEQLLAESATSFKTVWSRSPESGWSAPPVDQITGCYVLSLAALGPNGYRPDQLKNATDSSELRSARLVKGDLLISRANTVDTVGRAGIFSEDRDDVSFPDTMMRIHLADDVRPAFALVVLSSPTGRAHMRRTAAGSATSMVKINRTSLGGLSFPRVSVARQDDLLRTLHHYAVADKHCESESVATSELQANLSHAVFGGEQ